MSNVNTVTKENFEQEVVDSDKPVVLDFWATWCGPCKSFSPIFDKVSTSNTDVKFVKINVDEEKELAAQFGIRYCLGVTNPDSGIAEKQYQRHPSLNDYRRLIPSLM